MVRFYTLSLKNYKILLVSNTPPGFSRLSMSVEMETGNTPSSAYYPPRRLPGRDPSLAFEIDKIGYYGD